MTTVEAFILCSALRETLNSNPKQMRDQIMSQSVNILACYRKNCSNQSAEGQLILPEAMKLLPVYSNCIIKSTAVQGMHSTLMFIYVVVSCAQY